MSKKKPKRGGRKPGEWTHVQPEQIRAYRESKQVSRHSLAAMLGVSTTTVQNWETGRVVATSVAQVRIKALLSEPVTSMLLPEARALPVRVTGNGRPLDRGEIEATGRIISAYVQGSRINPAEPHPGQVVLFVVSRIAVDVRGEEGPVATGGALTLERKWAAEDERLTPMVYAYAVDSTSREALP